MELRAAGEGVRPRKAMPVSGVGKLLGGVLDEEDVEEDIWAAELGFAGEG